MYSTMAPRSQTNLIAVIVSDFFPSWVFIWFSSLSSDLMPLPACLAIFLTDIWILVMRILNVCNFYSPRWLQKVSYCFSLLSCLTFPSFLSAVALAAVVSTSCLWSLGRVTWLEINSFSVVVTKLSKSVLIVEMFLSSLAALSLREFLKQSTLITGLYQRVAAW